MGSVKLDRTLIETRPLRVTRWRRFRNRVINRFFDMFEGLFERGKEW